MDAVKLAYKPVGLALSAAAGTAAGAVTKRLWRVASGGSEPPDATQSDRSWREVLAAAALQGAVFGLVKAAVDRTGATAVKRLTGTWPQ
ncbi:DUF4235 domain-containing protein [Streptacidiphilus neutrinimicus]|uniref:DUF4235 domain-containing protein n=1 Tax=Streptacidiphilus neutrinimicus TaxID=105420 RepID=UPI0005A9E09B|nr:DUF4235 domain-containing protein [Streptacidiphilus neutrinimicus]